MLNLVPPRGNTTRSLPATAPQNLNAMANMPKINKYIDSMVVPPSLFLANKGEKTITYHKIVLYL